MSGRSVALAGTAVLALLAAVPAAPAKEGVTATIERPASCNAAAGTTITVAFWLRTSANGRLEPFGAGGVFVRLRRFGGRPALRRPAASDRTGHYTVRTTVPRGGIRRIDVGLHGTSTTGAVRRDADVFFRVVHDPCRAAR